MCFALRQYLYETHLIANDPCFETLSLYITVHDFLFGFYCSNFQFSSFIRCLFHYSFIKTSLLIQCMFQISIVTCDSDSMCVKYCTHFMRPIYQNAHTTESQTIQYTTAYFRYTHSHTYTRFCFGFILCQSTINMKIMPHDLNKCQPCKQHC